MITRAIIVAKINNFKWLVNIPILLGVPDIILKHELEVNESKGIYSSAIGINIQDNHPAYVINKDNEYPSLTLNSGQILSEWKNVDPQTLIEFTVEASVCYIPGISNTINLGDVVIVGFEDNDMGKPIILGHLLTEDIVSQKNLTYPTCHLREILVDETTTLSTNTKIINTDENNNKTSLNIYETLQEFVRFNGTYGSLLSKLSKIYDNISGN